MFWDLYWHKYSEELLQLCFSNGSSQNPDFKRAEREHMSNTPYKFLFLCTGNSARSIFGEYLLRHLGGSRFEVYSAGAFPTGKVNPFAIQVLKDCFHIDASEARSKSM